MPPFKPGWILTQVARPARILPIRNHARLPSQRHLSATAKCLRRSAGKPSHNPLEDENFRVNIYDEDDTGTARRRTADSDVSAEEQEVDRELQDSIDELQHDTEGDGFSGVMSEETISQLFSDEERQALQGRVEQVLADSDILAHQVHASSMIPRQSQLYLDRLNESLDQVSLGASREQLRKNVWKWYERCKTNVPDFLRMIPKAGWDMIWQSQSAGSLGDVDRSSHLRVLAQDKKSIGWTLSEAEQLAELEGTYVDGDRSSAIEEWCNLRKAKARPEKALLESGVHMFSLENQASKAEEVLDDLFDFYPQSDARASLSVIACCCRANDTTRAWKLYQRLQNMLKSEMVMADYDEVCKGLLFAGDKNAALAVFRDMIIQGESQKTSTFQPMERLAELVGLSSSSHEANRMSLESMTFLPRRFQNKMFYASWLKKLIGEGDVDAASLVIDLMYERGVKPDAKHMNGLLGAWLRDGSPASRKKAEERAWTMIQRRIDFTENRRLEKKPDAAVEKKSVSDHTMDTTIPVSLSRPVPPATIETFCILVQHYLRRNEFGHVKHLCDLLADAEIPMNSFFMNHLLHAELRNRGYRAVYSRFEVMSRDIRPDFETWNVLWQCMKHHLDTVKNQEASGFPSPRDLFAQMMQWYFSLQEHEAVRARDDMDIDAYNDIVRGFCLARDLEGVFVTMHAMQHLFGMLPDERTAHMLILMVARLDIMPATKQWLAHRTTRSSRNMRNIAQTTEVLDMIRKHRQSQMAELGLDISQLGPEARAEENHKTLLSLVFAVLSRRSEGMQHYHAAINAAASDMGVEGFDVDNSMALIGPRAP